MKRIPPTFSLFTPIANFWKHLSSSDARGASGFKVASLLGLSVLSGIAWNLARSARVLATDDAPARALAFNQPVRASLTPGESVVWTTPNLTPGSLYTVDVSLDRPSQLTTPGELVPRKIASPITFNVVKEDVVPPGARVELSFESAGNPTIAKKLHAGDPGGYFIIRAEKADAARLVLNAPKGGDTAAMGYQAEIRPLDVSAEDSVRVVPSTARDWQHASPMRLGQTVFGTSDDIEYLYNTEEGKVGWQWLTFEFNEAKPKLAYFELDILDRDVPCTMKLYHEENGPDGRHLADYKKGIDPTEIRHDDQNDELVGFKFISRVLTPGRYYLAVKANDPRWSLRTVLYDVPPYKDPRQTVEVAMRYMVDIGDSFFSNTPRKGAVRTRAENVTDETERCITCHPAHFTMLSTLTAVRNGYTVANPPQFKFMMDKLYNAPAPFYGFPDTYWLRFELAPTNGISRLGKMLLLYEDYVSHRPTPIPDHTASYLRLVYDARDVLPRADTAHYMEKFQPTKTRNYEFDGNRPISDFRVATDSWFVLHRLARRRMTGSTMGGQAAPGPQDPLAKQTTGRQSLTAGCARSVAHLEKLITSTSTNDLEDIVEQTKGLVRMTEADPKLAPKFTPLIRENIQKIFARQHDDGGWVTAEYMSNEQFFDAAARAPFEKKSDPSLQFMTGEVLYTLKLAGYSMNDPRVQKAIHWLLGLQRDFGGWLDNKGELFLMPHLETKWAVMGLSQIYPEHSAGMAAGRPGARVPVVAGPRATPRSAGGLVATLDWLDQLWYARDEKQLKLVLPLLHDPQPLVREAAASAIGRMAVDDPQFKYGHAVRPLVGLLGDHTKMVSRAAAWSLRQLANDEGGSGLTADISDRRYGRGMVVDEVARALDSPDDYTRRGAARVFYQYAYHVMNNKDNKGVAQALIAHVGDPDMLVRIECLKALWRWWYRTSDFELRREMERSFFARGAEEREHPLVRLNVAQALYNILDENTVQFHSNWLRSMALKEDRERAEAARIENVEKPLAAEIAAAITPENPTARLTVLTALDYYFLRGGIGNDYDFITFYDRDAAETVARALLPLIDSPDPAIAAKALRAAAVARDAKDRDLVLALMRRLESPDHATRDAAEQELARFPADYSSPSHVAQLPTAGRK